MGKGHVASDLTYPYKAMTRAEDCPWDGTATVDQGALWCQIHPNF